MPNITLRDYVTDDLGAGIANIRVRAYAIDASGDPVVTHEAETFTASGDGEWELTVNTDNAPDTGQYAIEIYNSTTGETRWRRGDIGLQVEYLVGPDGAAPIADQSITTAKIALQAVGTGQIADDAVTIGKIADITVDDSSTPASDTGTLQALLDGITNRLKAITGEVNWYDAPDTTIASLASGQGITVSSSAPVGPSTNDVWIQDHVSGEIVNNVFFWNGASWEQAIGGNALVVQAPQQIFDSTPSTLDDVIDAYAYQLDAIIGETNWYDTPNTNLATLAAGGSTATELNLPNTSSGYLYDNTGGTLALTSGYQTLPSLSVATSSSGIYLVMALVNVSASGTAGESAGVYMTFAKNGATDTSFETLETILVGEYRMMPLFGVFTNPGALTLKGRVTSQAATVNTDFSSIIAIKIS